MHIFLYLILVESFWNDDPNWSVNHDNFRILRFLLFDKNKNNVLMSLITKRICKKKSIFSDNCHIRETKPFFECNYWLIFVNNSLLISWMLPEKLLLNWKMKYRKWKKFQIIFWNKWSLLSASARSYWTTFLNNCMVPCLAQSR